MHQPRWSKASFSDHVSVTSTIHLVYLSKYCFSNDLQLLVRDNDSNIQPPNIHKARCHRGARGRHIGENQLLRLVREFLHDVESLLS